MHVTAGQAHESASFETVVGAVKLGRRDSRFRALPKHLSGDKGYDIPRIRAWLRGHRIGAVIPEKAKPHGRKRGRPPQFDSELYRGRNVIERCIGWLKQARRIATRFEKLAVNFLSMLKLAMLQRYFRLHLRDTT